MYPCPLDHCDVPMYNNEWHKDKQCAFWKLDSEERFEYYEHLDDAKSAKYKAKIEFYQNEENENQTANNTSKEELIKHGRFFFYDTIIPLNSNLKIEPDDIKSEDIFDDAEYEQFDEDYIGFNHFEDINVNLSSSKIINHSLKFFAQQSLVHKKTKLQEYLFFDSNDDNDNELLVNLFKEIDLQPKLQTNQEKFSIINIINNKLNQQSKNDDYNNAVIEMQNRLKYITNSDIYNNYVHDFLRNYPDFIKPKSFFENHEEVPYNNNNYINQLFQFHDNYKELRVPRSKTKFKIVYLTSGGGKTHLSKKHHLYLDIDAFIARHYNKFKLVENFCAKYKDYSLMSLFFKHTFFNDIDFLQGKILLCNHPNQLPNQFRLGYNEMVLIPQQLNWDIRWFNENYFSLLAIQGKIKYLSDYDNYNKIIFNHFIKCKHKMNINSNMYEII
jgi:hypothetical protein